MKPPAGLPKTGRRFRIRRLFCSMHWVGIEFHRYGQNKDLAVPQNFRFVPCVLLAFLLFSTVAYTKESKGENENTQQVIEFLIDTIAQSHLTFIRNGENHTCGDAAKHIREKYDYYRCKIKSPEDFICLCASKSMLSGKPYLVETDQGRIPVEKWLSGRLAEHLKELKHS
jgi:hypothetical protein